MPDAPLHLLQTLAAAANPPWTSVNALSTLLTVESFLFGFVSLAIGVTTPTERGNRLISKPGTFARLVATFITGVALGAVVAWLDLFVSVGGVFSGTEPDDVGSWLGALLVLGAVVVQPMFVWGVAMRISNPKPGTDPTPPLAAGPSPTPPAAADRESGR